MVCEVHAPVQPGCGLWRWCCSFKGFPGHHYVWPTDPLPMNYMNLHEKHGGLWAACWRRDCTDWAHGLRTRARFVTNFGLWTDPCPSLVLITLGTRQRCLKKRRNDQFSASPRDWSWPLLIASLSEWPYWKQPTVLIFAPPVVRLWAAIVYVALN